MRAIPLHALLLMAVSVTALAAQGHLVRGEFHAELTAGAPAHVRLHYALRTDSTAASVPVSVLRFGGTSIDSLTVRVNGNTTAVVLREESPAILRGEVPLGGGGSGEITLEFDYTVSVEESGRIRLPVVAVLWAPDRPRPSLFTGGISLESRFAVYNPFPATLRSRSREGDVQQLALAMPVLPAVIAFDRAPVPPRVTLSGLLDAVVVLLTVAFCGVLWLQFRRQQRA